MVPTLEVQVWKCLQQQPQQENNVISRNSYHFEQKSPMYHLARKKTRCGVCKKSYARSHKCFGRSHRSGVTNASCDLLVLPSPERPASLHLSEDVVHMNMLALCVILLVSRVRKFTNDKILVGRPVVQVHQVTGHSSITIGLSHRYWKDSNLELPALERPTLLSTSTQTSGAWAIVQKLRIGGVF